MITHKLTRGERFKDARLDLNKNGKQTMRMVADATGIAASLLKDLEDDENNRSVGYDKIAVLAKHYGVSSDWLLGITDDSSLRSSAVDDLGLSTKAVQQIIRIGISNSDSLAALNGILEDSYLSKMLVQINQIANAVAAEKVHLEKLQEAGKKVPFHHLGEAGAEMYENQTSTALLLELARNHSEIHDLEKRIMLIFGMEAIGKRIDSIGENFADIIKSIVKYDELAGLRAEVWGYSENK